MYTQRSHMGHGHGLLIMYFLLGHHLKCCGDSHSKNDLTVRKQNGGAVQEGVFSKKGTQPGHNDTQDLYTFSTASQRSSQLTKGQVTLFCHRISSLLALALLEEFSLSNMVIPIFHGAVFEWYSWRRIPFSFQVSR